MRRVVFCGFIGCVLYCGIFGVSGITERLEGWRGIQMLFGHSLDFMFPLGFDFKK